MSFLIVALASLFASTLTLFSGFGLGTLMLPIFALFMSAEVAVAATAIVHGVNNVFKVSLVGRHANWPIVLRFGIPAILAAFMGAGLLIWLSGMEPLHRYSIGQREAIITPLKLALAALMIFFSLFELVPRLRNIRLDHRYLPVGGLLSGFFGGLSGHQGALRATFLTKAGLSTESFVGTNAVIGLLVDVIRLSIYFIGFAAVEDGMRLGRNEAPLLIVGSLAAIVGVIIGSRYLKKVKMSGVQMLTGILLVLIAVALGVGIV